MRAASTNISLAAGVRNGDYGLGFFGNALESGAYYVKHPRLGPAAEGGAEPGSVVITPEDAYHRRVFVEPLALYLVAGAGTIARVQLQLSLRRVSLVLEWGETPWTQLHLSMTQPSAIWATHA